MKTFTSELRSKLEGNTLSGYAHVFGHVAQIGNHWERMAPTAFNRVLESEEDTVFVYNHERAEILGRRSAGNLKLHTDDVGLAFEVELPNTSLANDVKELVRSGIINAMSFNFWPGDEKWERASDGRQLNTHLSVSRLKDVSLVPVPAYDGTQVMLRSMDEIPVLDLQTQLIRARHAARFNALKEAK